MNYDLRKIAPCLLCVSIFLIIGQFQFVESVKCVKRLDGACKVFNVTTKFTGIKLKDFSSPPPEGYLLKTSIEINYRDNLYNYENRLNEETGKIVAYANRLDVVTIVIPIELNLFSMPEIVIDLGLKNDRMARLSYVDREYGVDIRKWSTFTPLLPRFPYHLRLQITESRTFSAYGDGNEEPFFTFQIDNHPTEYKPESTRYNKNYNYTDADWWFKMPRFSQGRLYQDGGNGNVRVFGIGFLTRYGKDELVAFADCSSLFTDEYCGTHHIDSVYNCERSFDGGHRRIKVVNQKLFNFLSYQTEPVDFDVKFVLDVKKQFQLNFDFETGGVVLIDFYPDSISAILFNESKIVKTVKTKTLYEFPISLYAVRVQITNNGADNNYFNIFNMRGDLILAMRLCWSSTVSSLGSTNPVPNIKQKIYFDCEPKTNPAYLGIYHYDDFSKIAIWGGGEEGREITNYNEIGYNFTKTLIDTRHFVDHDDNPSVLYEDASGHISTDDWCEGERLPQLYVPKTGKNAITDTEKINQQILSELKSQNNLTAAVFKGILTELQNMAHGTDRLYGCRESLAQNYGGLVIEHPVADSNEQNVFDEFFVVDLKATPVFRFYYDNSHLLVIEFKRDGIVASLGTDGEDYFTPTKIVESKWNQDRTNQFAVRLEIFSASASNYLKISNIRGGLILQVKICWDLSLSKLLMLAASSNLNIIKPVYFDCMSPHEHYLPTERPMKFVENRFGLIYNENGYDFTEQVLDSRSYVDLKIQQPPVLYKDKDINGHISTDDWCEGELLPQLYVPKANEGEYNGQINKDILVQLQPQTAELQSLNNASSAVTLKEILLELQSIKATIDVRNVFNASTVAHKI